MDLGDVKLLERLKEVLILEGQLFELSLRRFDNINLEDFTRVFKDLTVSLQVALNIEVEDEVVRLERAQVKPTNVPLKHEVDWQCASVLSDVEGEDSENGGDMSIGVHQ